MVWLMMRPSGSVSAKVSSRVDLGELGDPLHRPVERLDLPLLGVRRAIEHGADALGREQHAERAGALGAERALVDRAARIALDVDGLAVLRVDQLAAADRAIGADAGADAVGLLEPRSQRRRGRALRRLRHRVLPGELPRQAPVVDETNSLGRSQGLAKLLRHALLRPRRCSYSAQCRGGLGLSRRPSPQPDDGTYQKSFQGGDRMQTMEGIVTLVQESRFQLTDERRHRAPFRAIPRRQRRAVPARRAAAAAGAHPRQLPYEVSPTLIANIAKRIDLCA